MKILVTGASGFIGGYVTDNLLTKGHEVLAFDHKEQPHRDGVTQFLGDTRDFTAVSEAMAISDGFIHLAGVLGTQETVNEPRPAVETNIMGGLNVFQAARNYKVKGVYIAVGNHWMNNSYSITKTTAERFAFMFNKEHGTKIAVVRGLNVYGPRQKAFPVKKIMPNLILPALKGEDIIIYGDGEQVMDMIYAKDMAEVLVRALLLDHGVYDKVFEAGRGHHTTVNQIAEAVVRQVGKGNITHTAMRPGETLRSVVVADPSTLIPLFAEDYTFSHYAFTPLEDGIAETIAYYKGCVDVDGYKTTFPEERIPPLVVTREKIRRALNDHA